MMETGRLSVAGRARGGEASVPCCRELGGVLRMFKLVVAAGFG